MTWLFIVGLTLSSSLDNLGVGITYGIRKIRVGFLSNALISTVCFVLSYLGILFGRWVSSIIPGILPMLLSTALLFAIGFRIIWLSFPRERGQSAQRVTGLSSILKNPECVDFDRSQHIGPLEALVLGFALAANALTNSLSAGLLGYSPLVISLAASIGSFLTVWLGVKIGQTVADIRIGSFRLGQFGTLISGILLVLIAINSFLA